MRLLTLGFVVALSGCSFIGARRPDPPPYVTRPDCADGYARPVADAVLGAAGVGAVGLGAYGIAQGPAADGTSPVPGGAVLIAGGAVLAGVFIASAVFGFPRIGACQEAVVSWETAHPGEKPASIDVLAREFLVCPVGDLITDDISFGRNNTWADPFRWGRFQISGCGKMTWCAERDGRMRCGPPPDLQLAAQQVAVETGCGVDAIHQLQRFAAVTHLGRHELSGQVTYRMEACGQQYSCTVPVYAPFDNETVIPVIGERQLACKPVGALAPVDAPPPPPPPSN